MRGAVFISSDGYTMRRDVYEAYQAFVDFYNAYNRLNNAWSRLPSTISELLVDGYPFDKSFDELEIVEWVTKSRIALEIALNPLLGTCFKLKSSGVSEMRIRHSGEKPVKVTTEHNGVTFLNVPATTCNCGEELLYSGQQIGILEGLTERVQAILNPGSVTIDLDKVNPDLIEEIARVHNEAIREIIRSGPQRRSLEELEQELVKAYGGDNDGEEIIDCQPKSH